MELGIKNRTALVCAASSGIGRAIAQSLANEGVHVAICSRNEKNLKATQEALQAENGSEVVSVVADLSLESDIDRLVETVQTQLGSIDILINNVGGPAPGGLMELSEEQWNEGFQLSLMSVVRLTKAVLPDMKEQQWGRIVAIASSTAKEPREELLLSSTIRAGIAAFNKAIAAKLVSDNILVHTVSPGPIGTERVLRLTKELAANKNITFEEAQQHLVNELPMGRMGKPEEVASLVTYLVSQQSSFMTGNFIAIDGGQLKTW
ncbi:SDR family oxidoreductase [Okeania sp. SIO2B9]|uniref:SDR family oxidoreductase n=1 Tax=Okeania sp. SIO2B9 TaxID=2607782 RepID=UPI00142C9D6C|nr:SDR family oxidoreductase [Okeania sp. SIO2B9]NES90345.1 SDR family oxidoreductase [Okeania sp. SIO2B9]